MRILNVVKTLWKISIFKTIIFNFNYFPFKTAIIFPVIVYNNVILKKMNGKIVLTDPLTGSIKLGYKFYDFLTSNDKLIWLQNGGVVELGNDVVFGQGLFVKLKQNGFLKIGSNTNIPGGKNSKIISSIGIYIGNNCRFSWDVRIIDTSFHYLINKETGERNNIKGIITIGNNNWIGANSKIYKNTRTANFSTFGANSILTRDYTGEEYNVWVGNPPRIIKRGWYRCLLFTDS